MNDKNNKPMTFIDRIARLLDEGKPQAAIDLIFKSNQKSCDIENAFAVCLMRLGKFDKAIPVLSGLLYPRGIASIPEGTPVIYQANFVLATLKANKKGGALAVLRQFIGEDREHSSVAKLNLAVKQWKKSLNLLDKIKLAIGIIPNKPVLIDGISGDLI